MSKPFKMKGSPMQRNFGIGASPVREVTKPMKPASSKEELIKLAGELVPEVKTMDLDYGGGFAVGVDVMSGEPDATTTPKPKPSGEKPIVTRTPEEIMGIKKHRIKAQGASKQERYKSGGGFGEDNKDKKAPEIKTYKTADESKNTPEPKVRVMTPKELTKKEGKKKTKKKKKKRGKKNGKLKKFLKRIFSRKNK
tara:strand:- start:52 stop:636 length:585 start_codon:yes stop_codon:yes gene_type:complete